MPGNGHAVPPERQLAVADADHPPLGPSAVVAEGRLAPAGAFAQQSRQLADRVVQQPESVG